MLDNIESCLDKLSLKKANCGFTLSYCLFENLKVFYQNLNFSKKNKGGEVKLITKAGTLKDNVF